MPEFDLDRIGAGLPFAASLDALRDALTRGVAVVQAPPGTGKTTLAPPLVANHVAGVGRVILTQPRRVAVRAAARRLAQLSGTTLGEHVGYAVRGDARTSASTLVEFVTPGLLVRRLLADPELTGVAAVVLDEVHERSLDSDLLVGMLADVRELRDDLALVAMSATLDAPTFADVLAGDDGVAPLVDCPSALHPLTLDWAPFDTPRTDARGVTRDFLDHVARVTVDAARTSDDDALVFLPGVREVSHVADAVRRALPDRDVLELHGRVDAREQDRITAGRGPDEPRRVIVSTAIAESSLTVPGVRLVIDAGLSREPRRDAARGMAGLVTVACSRASAEQRAGRAARLGPGRVVRCYDERTFARMPEHVTPEISTADLTSAALTLAAWGTPGGVGLRLPTAPPAAALHAADESLTALGAFDGSDDGRLTPLGRTLADLPTDPRLGRALLVAGEGVDVRRAAGVVAALSDDLRANDADLARALRELSGPTRARWSKERDRLTRLAEHRPSEPARDTPPVPGECADGFVVALAYPERVARRVTDGVYLHASGTRAALPPNSPLRHHEWLAVADATRADGRVAQGTGAVVRLAAPLTRELAERAASHLLVDEVRATWDDGRVTARRVQALGAIEFSATPTKPTPEAARAAVHDALHRHGLDLLTWSDEATALRRRLAFLHHHLGELWPAMDDTSLLDRADEWLGPELDALARGAKASSVRLLDPLRRLLPWPEATRLDDLAPERFEVPSGSRIRVSYPEDPADPPVVAVKLQECFGLDETPRLADGRAPVLFHLLSPAGRPLAITDDLASFWAGPYAGVRADMRGRYPKHPWPEDPTTHVATAKTKNRLGSQR